jgi:lysophospholipase L1-like esterase
MRVSRFVSAVAALGLSAVLTAVGVQSAEAAAVNYVALGDSYSSGVGAGDYGSSGDCKRSANAYPAKWAAAHAPSSFSFTACSGAVTDDVINKQLGPVNSATTLVSISVGGNDVGFADVMTTCVLNSESTCLSRVQQARTAATSQLPAKLDRTYAAIKAKAPSAKVVVLGYPRLYKLGGSCIVGLSETERSALNGASDHLNTVISQRASAAGFAFGDVRPAFTGHEICSGDSWLHSVTWPIGDSYHPTAAGQTGGYLPTFSAKA